MNSSLLRFTIVAALGGFLFGFDTVVISGADQALQELWNSPGLFHGFVVMSSALWGTVIGALLGNFPTDKLGRKKTLIWIGALYLISALGSALSNDPYVFSFFRFLGGVGVGVSTIAAPAYISEIAPAAQRGRLVALYQFNIVFGILMAFVSNYLLQNTGAEPWRWMIGMEAVPAFLYCVLVWLIPESPRWLVVKRNDTAGAKAIFKQISSASDAEIDATIKLVQEDAQRDVKHERLFDKKHAKIALLAFMLAFFNQVSGINAILYYAPRILNEAGLGESAALFSGIGLGLVNLVFTMLGIYMIDRSGRKTLMYIGSFLYITSLGLVASSFFLGWQGIAVTIFLMIFIAGHAIGQGSVIWVFISEIFPTHLRAKGQSLGSGTHWVLAALVTLVMPPLLSGAENPGWVFVVFALMMVGQLLWVTFVMPETKGRSLEQIEEDLSNG